MVDVVADLSGGRRRQGTRFGEEVEDDWEAAPVGLASSPTGS